MVTRTVNGVTEGLRCGIAPRATAFGSIALVGQRRSWCWDRSVLCGLSIRLSAYCVGKIAQTRLVEEVAVETGDFDVAAFAIDPGFVFTDGPGELRAAVFRSGFRAP